MSASNPALLFIMSFVCTCCFSQRTPVARQQAGRAPARRSRCPRSCSTRRSSRWCLARYSPLGTRRSLSFSYSSSSSFSFSKRTSVSCASSCSASNCCVDASAAPARGRWRRRNWRWRQQQRAEDQWAAAERGGDAAADGLDALHALLRLSGLVEHVLNILFICKSVKFCYSTISI